MTRRQLLALLGHSSVAAFAQLPSAPTRLRIGDDPIPPPAPVPPPGTKAVLTPADLRLEGFYRFPIADLFWNHPSFALRKVNGQTRLFCNANVDSGEYPLMEFAVPSSAPSLTHGSAPALTTVRNWGKYRAGHVITNNRDNPNYPGGLFWDDQTSTLWWTYADGYIPSYWFPNVGATKINDATGGFQSYGPWSTTWLPQRTLGKMVPIPEAFAKAYTGGKRIGMGAFPSSGAAGGPWGACLSAASLPDPVTTPPDPWNATPRSIVNHGLLLHDLEHRQARNTRYNLCGYNVPYDPAQGGTLVRGQPIFGSQNPGSGTMDAMTVAAWVDLPDKHGVIFLGTLASTPSGVRLPNDADGYAHMWYGPGTCVHGQVDPFFQATGPATAYRQTMAWIYNPDDLVNTATGKTPLYGVTPSANEVEMRTIHPFFDHKAPGGVWGGAVFDPESRRLYVPFLYWPHPANAVRLCVVFRIA